MSITYVERCKQAPSKVLKVIYSEVLPDDRFKIKQTLAEFFANCLLFIKGLQTGLYPNQ